MSDRVNCRTEVRENPFGEIWIDSQLSRYAWEEAGKHGHPMSYRDYKAHELEKELKEAKPVAEHYSNKGLAEEKNELLTLLDAKFGKDVRGIFLDQLRQFEVRAWANAISKNEIAETYKQLGRILKAEGNAPLTPDLRQQVARDVIRYCADPTIISQGHHNTCNVTAVEVRTYALYPAKAVKLVADVATSGEYCAKNGVTVKLDAESMVPDNEALKDRPAQGLRTYATQLFNLAAVNVWYSAVRPGTRYEQRQQIVKGKPETVEQLVDYSSGKPVTLTEPFSGQTIDSPFLGDNQIAFISDAIVGKHEPFAVLKVGPSMCWLPGEKNPNTKAADIIDEQELPNILATLKKRHLLPAIAGVDTDVEPLNKDTGSGAYGPGGGHVVNLFDYSAGPQPKVAMDNQWEKKADHLSPDKEVDLHDMFLCMAGKEAAQQDAEVRAEEADKSGKPNPVEGLRAFSFESTFKSAQAAVHALSKNQDAERSLSGNERTKWLNTLQAVVNRTPVIHKTWLLKQVSEDKVCSDEEFGRLIAGAVHSISHQKREAADAGNTGKRALCIRATSEIAEYLTTLPVTVKKSYFQSVRDR